MKQITIVTEHSAGLLARISEILAANDINIESLDAETILDHGVAILTVDRYDEALAVLRDEGLPAVSEDAIVVRIADEPGALAKLSRSKCRNSCGKKARANPASSLPPEIPSSMARSEASLSGLLKTGSTAPVTMRAVLVCWLAAAKKMIGLGL